MVADAAQRYGIIVRDTTHGSFAFYAEIPDRKQATVYAGRHSVWGHEPSWKALDRFPWRRLELLNSTRCRLAPCNA
jgi:hypothetical protein